MKDIDDSINLTIAESARVLHAVMFVSDPLGDMAIPWCFIDCGCDPALVYHSLDCPLSPIFSRTIRNLGFNHLVDDPVYINRIHNTWVCAVHGLLGEVNGPIHYETCWRGDGDDRGLSIGIPRETR